MMQETGVVTAVEHNVIHVQTQIKTTCGGCQQNEHCGTGVIARALTAKNDDLVLPFTGKVEVGQLVTLGIPEVSLLGASALVYLLPLLMIILAMVIAHHLLPAFGLSHELWAALAGLLSGTLSFAVIRHYVARHHQHYQPQLLAVLPSAIAVKNVS